MASQLPSTSASSPIDAALQVEYYHLQKTIEDFDGRALTIKAWSVTFGFASLVGAFASKARLVFVIAAVGALLFWLLEAFWKSFQLGYYERVWTDRGPLSERAPSGYAAPSVLHLASVVGR